MIDNFGDRFERLLEVADGINIAPYNLRYELERLREAHRREICDLLATIAAERREKEKAAAIINEYLDNAPLHHKACEWLRDNGFENTSYQADIIGGQYDN